MNKTDFLSIKEKLQRARNDAYLRGWNEAIEAAAEVGENFEIKDDVSSRIRALKKPSPEGRKA